MSSLPDWRIEQYALDHQMISPYNKDQLNPGSYDVLLDDTLLIEHPTAVNERIWKKIDISQKQYMLSPGEFVLGCTQEVVRIPDHLEGVFCLKSSRGREGYNHMLAAYLDSGFIGKVTLEIHNCNRFNSLPLYKGLRIGQIRFSQMESEPLKSYSKTGRYHLDMGPVPSKG